MEAMEVRKWRQVARGLEAAKVLEVEWKVAKGGGGEEGGSEEREKKATINHKTKTSLLEQAR